MRKLTDNKKQRIEPIKELNEPLIESKNRINISTYILYKIVNQLRKYRSLESKINNSIYFQPFDKINKLQDKTTIKNMKIETKEEFKIILLFYKNLNCLKIVKSIFVDFSYFNNSFINKLILEDVKDFNYKENNKIKEIEFRNSFNEKKLIDILLTKKIKCLALNNIKIELNKLNIEIPKFISINNKLCINQINNFLLKNKKIKYYNFIEKDFELFYDLRDEIEIIFYSKNFEIKILPNEVEFLHLEDCDISNLIKYIEKLKKLRKIIIKNCYFSFIDFIESLKNKEIIHLSLENVKFSYSSINKLVYLLKDTLRSFKIINSDLPSDFIDVISTNLKNCKVFYGENKEIYVT